MSRIFYKPDLRWSKLHPARANAHWARVLFSCISIILKWVTHKVCSTSVVSGNAGDRMTQEVSQLLATLATFIKCTVNSSYRSISLVSGKVSWYYPGKDHFVPNKWSVFASWLFPALDGGVGKLESWTHNEDIFELGTLKSCNTKT